MLNRPPPQPPPRAPPSPKPVLAGTAIVVEAWAVGLFAYWWHDDALLFLLLAGVAVFPILVICGLAPDGWPRGWPLTWALLGVAAGLVLGWITGVNKL